MSSQSEKRLKKELMELIKNPIPGLKVDEESVSQNLSQWLIEIMGAEDTLFASETFILEFKFNNKYPFDSPQVQFTGDNIPEHPHVYSNGHICLSILTDDWSPALSVQSVCLSITSMLRYMTFINIPFQITKLLLFYAFSSCTEKKRPPDNMIYVRSCSKNPKKTKWWYHDDTV
ncbi:unnamed protein product [Diamesa hyperborea]